jgi:AcrR family transcriptional regulator
MVYHYFGSKQGLYRTVFERRGRKSMDAMLSELSIDSSEEPLMAYRHILGVQFDLFARNPTYARMSAHEALDGFIRGFDPAKDPQTRFLAQTAPFFQKALAKKLFRDPAGPFNGMALASFLGLCFVLYRKRIEDLLQRLGREEADLAASYRETVLDTILHGLLATEFRD